MSNQRTPAHRHATVASQHPVHYNGESRTIVTEDDQATFRPDRSKFDQIFAQGAITEKQLTKPYILHSLIFRSAFERNYGR